MRQSGSAAASTSNLFLNLIVVAVLSVF